MSLTNQRSSRLTIMKKYSMFCTIYCGYTVYMLNRKSFTFAMPSIASAESLTKEHLGLIVSSQVFAYAISKFIGGVVADKISPRILFSLGLFLSGLVVILFSLCGSVYWFSLLWFINGLVQGGGWPACAKLIRTWFSPAEMATWWSLLSTSMNLAGSFGPILVTFMIKEIGWRSSFTIFGTISVGLTALCLLFIGDSPIDASTDALNKNTGSTVNDRNKGRGRWQDMLFSPFLWLVSFSYLVVFMSRTALQDWSQLFLIQERGLPPLIASSFISSVEIGGIIGTVAAGFLSDQAVARIPKKDTQGTPRMFIVMVFIFIYIITLYTFIQMVTQSSSLLLLSFLGACLGATLYGSISMYGVMSMEAAPSHLSGTSHAIVGLAANVGGVISGLPLSYLAKFYGWSSIFILLEICAISILILKFTFRNLEYKMVPTKKKLS